MIMRATTVFQQASSTRGRGRWYSDLPTVRMAPVGTLDIVGSVVPGFPEVVETLMVIRQLGPLETRATHDPGQRNSRARAGICGGSGSWPATPTPPPRQTPPASQQMSTTWIMDVEQPSFIITHKWNQPNGGSTCTSGAGQPHYHTQANEVRKRSPLEGRKLPH